MRPSKESSSPRQTQTTGGSPRRQTKKWSENSSDTSRFTDTHTTQIKTKALLSSFSFFCWHVSLPCRGSNTSRPAPRVPRELRWLAERWSIWSLLDQYRTNSRDWQAAARVDLPWVVRQGLGVCKRSSKSWVQRSNWPPNLQYFFFVFSVFCVKTVRVD